MTFSALIKQGRSVDEMVYTDNKMKEEKLEKLRVEKEEKEMQNVTFQPLINKAKTGV